MDIWTDTLIDFYPPERWCRHHSDKYFTTHFSVCQYFSPKKPFPRERRAKDSRIIIDTRRIVWYNFVKIS